jgi:UPF0755 protein
VLIVASMVQAEGVDVDFPKIARVAYNRLNSDDPSLNHLQFDSTTNYWLEMQGKGRKNSYDLTQADLENPNNPYSTTSHTGLPPGPIGNPGLKAMQGAEAPAAGPWVFFVKFYSDGRSAFETTSAQHDADVQAATAKGIK